LKVEMKNSCQYMSGVELAKYSSPNPLKQISYIYE